MYHITILEPPHNLHNLHNLARLNAMSSFTLASSAPSKTIARAHARRGAARGARVVVHAAKKKQDATEEDEAKIDFKGLKQLISMGLGTISGDITEVNLDDPTRTVVMELEANNFEDKDGKPLNFINNDGFVGEKGESVSALNYAVPVLLGAASIAGVVATLKALA